MKILLIHNYYRDRGGEDTYFESLSKLLRENGHIVIEYKKTNNDITDNLLTKFKIGINLLFTNHHVVQELSNLIQKEKPDIAHCNNIYPLITPTVYTVCKRFSLPIVQTIHNYRFLCPGGILYHNGRICDTCARGNVLHCIVHRCYRNSLFGTIVMKLSLFLHKKKFMDIDHFVFPSLFTQNYYLRHLSFTMKSYSRLPYFVPKKPVQKTRSDYFLYIGRLSEEKGIRELLEIFKNLPHVSLIVIGDGPLKKDVDTYRQYRNIHVKGPLHHEKIDNYLAEAKCVIITSKWYEVLPYVYLEALNLRTPVLVPDSPIFADSLEKSNNNIYKWNDFKDLRTKIMHIHQSPEIPFSGPKQDHYQPGYHLRQLEKLYHKLLSK